MSSPYRVEITDGKDGLPMKSMQFDSADAAMDWIGHYMRDTLKIYGRDPFVIAERDDVCGRVRLVFLGSYSRYARITHMTCAGDAFGAIVSRGYNKFGSAARTYIKALIRAHYADVSLLRSRYAEARKAEAVARQSEVEMTRQRNEAYGYR